MSSQKKLSPNLCVIVRFLSRLCEYDHFRISELLHPFVNKDERLSLSVLFKRMTRILESKVRNGANDVPGSFLIHSVDINYSKNEENLIVIVELYTGWASAVVTEKLRRETIVSTLYKTCDEIGMVFKEKKPKSYNPNNRSLRNEYELKKLPIRQIVIPTYLQKPANKKKGAKTTPQPKEMSHATNSSAVKLIEKLNKHLKLYDRKKITLKRISGGTQSEKLIIEGDYTRKELNERISEILHEYNSIDREQNKFPRTKEAVTPKNRLYEALKSRKKSLSL